MLQVHSYMPLGNESVCTSSSCMKPNVFLGQPAHFPPHIGSSSFIAVKSFPPQPQTELIQLVE